MITQERWDGLYRSALYESDLSRFPAKITKANHAILGRIQELHGSDESKEAERLRVALEILGDLRVIAGKLRRPDAA